MVENYLVNPYTPGAGKMPRYLAGRQQALEEAFKLYQEGVKLLKYCNGAIDKVEKKIIEIHGNEDEGDE